MPSADLFAIEQNPVVPRPGPAPPPDDLDWADDPIHRWPYHLPRWNAVDAFWWVLLCRAVYSPTETFVRQLAAWACPVARLRYVAPAPPPVVGHALIELADQWLCVVVGTSSDDERLQYLTTHAMEQLTYNPVDDWSINTTWYNVGQTVWADCLTWPIPVNKPLVALGHSSGGAYAAVVTLLRQGVPNTPPNSCITLGSPRWCTPSIRAFVVQAKEPQFIEFATPGDAVALSPPPWSVIDAARIQYPIGARPEYIRVGNVLELLGSEGTGILATPAFPDFFTAFLRVAQGNLGVGPHGIDVYTRQTLAWAQSFCAQAHTPELIQPLVAILAEMEAAGL